MPFKYTKNDTGLFICEECGKTAIYQSTMHYHLKSHSNEREFKCDSCEFTALTQQILQRHKEARHENQVVKISCPVQGCAFKDIRKGNVITHFMRSHLIHEVNAILEKKKDNGSVKFCCRTCDEEKNHLGSFLYHSVGCIRLPENDPRYAMLAGIM